MRALADWELTPERVAVHSPTATAVVADLHLGYSEARRRAGEAVPLVSVAEALAPLRRVLERHRLRRLVFAGDVFEAGHCRQALTELNDWINARGLDSIVHVAGNHDGSLVLPHADGRPVVLGDWQVVHGDRRLPRGLVVQGHEHPWVAWSNRLSGPCYLVRPDRLILPAYSADASGVNVVGRRRWADFTCFVIAGERVLDFGPVSGLRALGRRFGSPHNAFSRTPARLR